jgi:hypothetical protein
VTHLKLPEQLSKDTAMFWRAGSFIGHLTTLSPAEIIEKIRQKDDCALYFGEDERGSGHGLLQGTIPEVLATRKTC